MVVSGAELVFLVRLADHVLMPYSPVISCHRPADPFWILSTFRRVQATPNPSGSGYANLHTNNEPTG